jgi:hypothetical protein
MDELDDVVAAGDRVGAAAVGAQARDHVRGHRDETVLGQLIRHAAEPVGEAEEPPG